MNEARVENELPDNHSATAAYAMNRVQMFHRIHNLTEKCMASLEEDPIIMLAMQRQPNDSILYAS